MKQIFIVHEGHAQLLLFFAGWGMDEHPFAHHRPTDCDLLVCYDYRTISLDTTLLTSYQRVYVVAWSMGVWAASKLLHSSGLPIVHSTAINGTPYPIDVLRGIDPLMVNRTIKELCPITLLKFQRRMCGSVDALNIFLEKAPQRSIDELRQELSIIYHNSQYTYNPPFFKWHRAIISSHDRIFLPDNQLQAWEGTGTEVIHFNTAHYDPLLFASLSTAPKTFIKKPLVAARFGKAALTYPYEAIVQRRIALRMVSLLEHSLGGRQPTRLLEVGCGTGLYTQPMLKSLRPQQAWINDIATQMLDACAHCMNEHVCALPGDAEKIVLPQQLDVITSSSTLQWFNDLNVFFERCHQVLTNNGLLAFTSYGPRNLHEVTALTGQGLHYPSLEELTNALAPNYHILLAEECTIPLIFDTPMEVLGHLRSTGVNAVGYYRWNRRKLETFNNQYIGLFSTGANKVTLTYHPIYIIAQKK